MPNGTTFIALIGLLAVGGCRASSASSEPPSDEATATPPSGAAASEPQAGEDPTDGSQTDPRGNRGANDQPAPAEPPPPIEGPTEAQLEAWDRKDPGQAHKYEWDAINFGRLQSYFHDLECFQARMIAAGEGSRGVKAKTLQDKAWHRARRAIISEVNAWEHQLWVNEPQISENSDLLRRLLEAKGIVIREIPQGYLQDDQAALDRANAHWVILLAKFDKYAQMLGQTPTRVTTAHCRAMTTPASGATSASGRRP